MAGVSTIGTGGDYATIAAWESAVNTSSLTGVEEGLLLGEEFPEAVLIDGGASTQTDYVHLTAASGADFDSTTRTGARITQAGVSAYVDILHVKDFYAKVGGPTAGNGSSPGRIGISGSVTTGSGVGISGVRFRYADSAEVTNIHVFDLLSEDVTSGFRDDGSSASQITVTNCIASSIRSTGVDAAGFTSDGSPDMACRYCVADGIYMDNSTGDDAVGFNGILSASNCWASRCVSAAAGNTGVVSQGYYAVGTIDTCAGDDSTASAGLQNLDPTAQFVSLTAGAEDYHLLANSALIGAANDVYGVRVDIDGTTTARTSIGADEYETGVLTASIAAAWAVRRADSFATSWLIRAGSSVASAWNVFASSAAQAAWNIKTSASTPVSWVVRAVSSLGSSWAVRTASNVATSWFVKAASVVPASWRIRASSSAQTTWRVFSSRAVDTAWAILTSGATSIQTAWRISTTAATNTSWRVLAASSIASSWVVRTLKNIGASWGIRTGRSAVTSWMNRATSSVQSSWMVKAATTVSTSWRNKVSAAVDAAWNVLNAGKASVNVAWRIYTSDKADAEWHVRASSAIASSWRVFVARSLGTSWHNKATIRADSAWRIVVAKTIATAWRLGIVDLKPAVVVYPRKRQRVFTPRTRQRVVEATNRNR